jgi:hypothetical protein
VEVGGDCNWLRIEWRALVLAVLKLRCPRHCDRLITHVTAFNQEPAIQLLSLPACIMQIGNVVMFFVQSLPLPLVQSRSMCS